MSNSIQLQLRRGTLAQVQAMTPAMGELVVADDQAPPLIFLGDGTTAGGRQLIVAPDKLESTISAAVAVVTGSYQNVPLNDVILDTDGLLNTSTGAVTIKRAGFYVATGVVTGDASGTYALETGVSYNGSNGYWCGSRSSDPSSAGTVSFAANLNVGDVLTLQYYVATGSENLKAGLSYTRFSLIGPF